MPLKDGIPHTSPKIRPPMFLVRNWPRYHVSELETPGNNAHARAGPYRGIWEYAVDAEISSLKAMKTFGLPEGS